MLARGVLCVLGRVVDALQAEATARAVVSVLVAGAAVGACCHAASTPVGEPGKQRKCPGKEGVQRPVAWVDDCDPDPVPAGPHTNQLVPSKQLLIASGHVDSNGWPLAYLYVDPSSTENAVGRESFSWISPPTARTFKGNFSIGPANLAPIELADYFTSYCSPNGNQRFTVDKKIATCASLNPAVPPTTIAGTVTLLSGTWTNTDNESSGEWTISTSDTSNVGMVHLQGGHETWFVLSKAAGGPTLRADAKLHTFTQVPAPTGSPFGVLPGKAKYWSDFVNRVCGVDKPAGTIYDVYAYSHKCAVEPLP